MANDGYELTIPEYVGIFPVRQDIEIIPADPHRDVKFGWPVIIYNGSEVYKDVVNKMALTDRNVICSGDEVYVCFFDGGYRKAMVGPDCKYAETEYNLYILEFDTDDRHCWTSGSIINKQVLKLNLVDLELHDGIKE